MCLLQFGETPAAIRAIHGSCLPRYERAWGGPLEPFDTGFGVPAPDPRAFAGIIISGSSYSLAFETHEWMAVAADFVLRAHDAGTPVLGICFGHQLIGHAFGATVVTNPRGWEVGSSAVALTTRGRRDPLFAGMDSVIDVNFNHRDMLCERSLAHCGIDTLARNDQTAIQAIAIGDHIRGVQFHPELGGALMRAHIAAGRHALHAPDELTARAHDCPNGLAVLRNFRRFFVERA